MSEPEGRTPISVYLTPRAAMILREYNTGSGYGSVSRTVEEIILAFDFTYNTIKDALKTLLTKVTDSEEGPTDADRTMLWTLVVSVLWNIDRTISRLNKESPIP